MRLSGLFFNVLGNITKYRLQPDIFSEVKIPNYLLMVSKSAMHTHTILDLNQTQ